MIWNYLLGFKDNNRTIYHKNTEALSMIPLKKYRYFSSMISKNNSFNTPLPVPLNTLYVNNKKPTKNMSKFDNRFFFNFEMNIVLQEDDTKETIWLKRDYLRIESVDFCCS